MPTKKFKCDDCGTKVGVKEQNCPYKEEIYGKEEKAKLCKTCYLARAADI